MNRRECLGVVGTALASGLAGCGGGGSDEPERIFYLGDTVENGGVQLAINEYALVSEYVEWEGPEEGYPEDEVETPPTAGGVFLFARITVENVGGNRREFPDIGFNGITGTYNDQEVEFFKPDNKVRSDRGDEYESYTGIAEEEDLWTQGAFPGITVDAWIICEVPRAFDPASLRFETAIGSEDDTATRTWSFGNLKPSVTPEGYDHDIQTVTPTPTEESGG